MIQRLSMLALAIFGLVGQALAFERHNPEAWERENAWRLSNTPESSQHASQLTQLARAGDNRATLAYLQEIDRDPALPAPARERLYLEFVNGLRQEAPRTVGESVLGYLAAYPLSVFVPDEDHPRNLVPMFNVHAATAGLKNTWTHQESVVRGAGLIQGHPQELVDAYAKAEDAPTRRGLLDALSNATRPQRSEIAEAALSRSENDTGVAEVAARVALLNEDSDLLARLLARTHGDGVHRLLRNSAEIFDREQNARLLDAALSSGSAETAALALAELTPRLAGHAPSVDRIFGLLGDREAGSSAALALAGIADPGIITRLESISADPAGTLAAARAQLALQWVDDKMMREVQ